MLAAIDPDLMQSVSMAIGVQRLIEMNPVKTVFAGTNDHLHSRGFLSTFREPTTAKDAVSPAIKDILDSMGEIIDTLKDGDIPKTTFSEGKYDVIKSAPTRETEVENRRPLREELPAV